MTNKNLQTIADTNQLLKQTFGKGFKGNITYEGNPYDGMYTIKQCDELKNIHKDDFLTKLSFFFLGIPENAGFFSEGNPRKINVREKFYEEGLEYANLYEKRTGLNVEITKLDSDASWRIF